MSWTEVFARPVSSTYVFDTPPHTLIILILFVTQVNFLMPFSTSPPHRLLNNHFGRAAALQAHMKDIHQRFFCNLCLNNRPLFVSEQEVFGAAALRKHEARVDGHPLCRFCSER